MTQKEMDLDWAASQFLYEDLPEGYQDWPNKKLYEFLRMHAWKPFEHYSGEWLWAHIQDLAVSMRRYVEAN